MKKYIIIFIILLALLALFKIYYFGKKSGVEEVRQEENLQTINKLQQLNETHKNQNKIVSDVISAGDIGYRVKWLQWVKE